MPDAGEDAAVSSSTSGQIAVIYAGDYLNKLSGERIERECRKRLASGCRGLLINFRDTELVNSIGVSILLGVIDAAGSVGARLAFSDVNDHTVQLFNMLGLTRHVSLLENEASALSVISREISQGVES